MKKIVLLVVLAAAGAAVLIWALSREREEREGNVIKVSGNIETTEVELSFRIPGWVKQRAVSEGESIKEGDVVALMDKTELEQEVQLRKTEVTAAYAQLSQLEAGSRPEEIERAASALNRVQARLNELEAGSRPAEIAGSEAALKATSVEANRLKLDYERITKLQESGAATTQELDGARAAYESASERERQAGEQLKLVKEGPRKEEIEQARAAVQEAQATYTLAKKGPRREEIDRARAQTEQAEAAMGIAITHLGWTTLKSPVTGMVLSQNVESGEYVSAGTPVVTVADLTKVWLRAYVNETDLGRVKPGQKVEVTTDTYPGKVYAGRISFIAQEAEFTPKQVQTAKERVKLVYRVKIDIENEKQELKPGMPADGKIVAGE